MAQKTEPKSDKIEREYIIPIREKIRVVPRYKKTNKAVKVVKEFLVKHMKVRDRDLSKVKIDQHLNEALWFRGIRKPPYKIKVKAVKEGDIIRAELAEFSERAKFKKAKKEKQIQKAKELLEGKKSRIQQAKEAMTGTGPGAETPAEPTPEEKQTEEKKAEEKEKKAAVVEAGAKMEKAAAQKAKHATQSAGKQTKQKHQVRKALAK